MTKILTHKKVVGKMLKDSAVKARRITLIKINLQFSMRFLVPGNLPDLPGYELQNAWALKPLLSQD